MKDVNIILGERIKLGRKANNLTREKLAELIDVSTRFLAEVESGKVGVSLQTLKNITASLSTSTDYLLGLNEDKKSNKLEFIYSQLKKIDDKFYPLISKIVAELANIDSRELL